MRPSRWIPLAAAGLVLAFPFLSAQEPSEPRPALEGTSEPLPSALEEQVETRIIQLDVSVVDNKASERRSVPGLRKEMFELRVNGKRMRPEEYERVSFDEVCAGAEEGVPPDLLDRHLVIMLDFNYLNGQMRVDAARAIRRLADELPEAYRAKVVGYTRSLYEISPFTRDPEDLRRAAEFVETANWVGGPGPQEDLGPEFSPEGSPLTPLGTTFGPTVATDPWTAGAAAAFARINTTFGGGDLSGLSEALASVGTSPGRGLAEHEWARLARGALAALEAVLRGHSELHGRNALILFTGERFYLEDDYLERETEGVFTAAQGGFTIWVVDAQGFSGGGALPTFRSALVTMLAGNTGGETLRASGDLGVVFSRAQEALDCYYLFSIPVEGVDDSRAYSFVVSLRTRDYPELFGHVVRHRTPIRLQDRRTDRERKRTAALLNPDGWDTGLPVRAELSFPMGPGSSTLPLEVSVPLTALEYRPADGVYEASFLVDAAVDRDGKDTVCVVPGEKEATMHRVRLSRPPPPDSRGHLVIRDVCSYRGKGVYTVRAVVTDPEHAEPGATRASYRIGPEPGATLDVGALRVGHNTGQEYLLDRPGPGQAIVPHDREREAFVPLLEGDAAGASDTLKFRYVLCGPSREEAKDALHRLIYRREGESTQILFLLPGSNPSRPLPGSFPRDPFCVEIEDRLPPDSLKPGEYGFALIRGLPETRLSRAAIEEAVASGEGDLFLGKAPFDVH
jgi:VWFA-related protein